MGRVRILFILLAWSALAAFAALRADDSLQGFTSLFNGKNLSGWKVPEGDNSHWKVIDGVIDYDARSEAKGDKSLWSEKSYRDFVLRIDWKLKKEPGFVHRIPVILPDGNTKKGPDGKEEMVEIEDAVATAFENFELIVQAFHEAGGLKVNEVIGDFVPIAM